MLRSSRALITVPIFVSLTTLAARFAGPPDGASVTPDGATTPERDAYTGGYSASFTVKNTGQYTDEFNIWCVGIVNVTCTGTSTSLVTLSPGQQTIVYAYYNVGAPGTGEIELLALGEPHGYFDTGYYNVPVVSSLPAPIVDLSVYNYDNQDMSRCAGSCFAATYAHSTVPYYSLDTPRNVTLVYNGDRVDPRPFVHVNVSHPSGATPTPQEFWLQVKKGGQLVTFLNGQTTLKFTASSTVTQRLAGQIDASSWPDSVFNIDVLVTAYYGAQGTQTTTVQTKLAVVNEADSPIGRGWTIAGVQRLYPQGDNSALITEGDGSLVYFEKVGSSFVSPAGEFSTLKTSGSGWARYYPDSTRVVFNSSGRMTDVYDRFSNRTQFYYDGSQRLYLIKDPYGKYLGLGYGTYGYGIWYIRGYISPYRFTTFTVAPNHTISAIRDPDGDSTAFGYDGSLRLSSITDRRGQTTNLTYHSQSGRTSNKLTSITAPSVETDSGPKTPTTTLVAWQSVGVPYSTGTLGVIRADTVYARVTDPAGHTTKFTVDRWGQPVVTTDPLNLTTTATYNGDGLPVRVQYPDGGKDSTVFSSKGLPTMVWPAGGTAQLIQYNAVWVTLPDSTWGTGQAGVKYGVSGGKVTWVRVGAGGGSPGYTTSFQYDSRGRVTRVTRPPGYSSQTWYNGTNGNRDRDSVPGGRQTTYGYDAYGRLKWTQPPNGVRDSVQYDVINRVTASFDGVHQTPTRFSYDSVVSGGFASAVRDVQGQLYVSTYNALGWVVSQRDPTGASDNYLYSVDGELKRWTNRRNQQTNYTYDAIGRRLSKTGSGVDNVTFSYPGATGLITVAQNSVSTETVYSNVRGQLDSVKTVLGGKTYWRRYTYENGDWLKSVSATGTGTSFVGRNYTYNAARSTLESIKLDGRTTSFGYDSAHRPDEVTYSGGDVVDRQFTSINTPGSISTEAGYNPAVWNGIEYDNMGRIKYQVSEVTGEWRRSNFLYDALGRLVADTIKWSSGGSCTWDPHFGNICDPEISWQTLDVETYAYDAVGNRTDNGGQYSTGNRLEFFGGCSYGTDADGNVEEASCPSPAWRIHWTSDNMLMAKKKIGGDSLDFRYDGLGRLVRIDVNGSPRTYFLWDGSDLFAELDSAGAKVAEYSYYPGLDNLHALVIGSNPYYAHANHAGTVVALTDHSQALRRSRYQGDPWSADNTGAGSLPCNGCDRTRFKGAVYVVEADLTYMRGRWYSSHTGRFMSEDPLGIGGGINQYAYAGNDPVNHRDPTGLIFDERLIIPPISPPEPDWALGVWIWFGGGGTGIPIPPIRSLGMGPAGEGGPAGACPVPAPTGPGPDEPPTRPPVVRTPQECFDQSIAPALELARKYEDWIIGTGALTAVRTALGRLTEQRGILLRNFKGRPVFGGVMIAAGKLVFEGGVYMAVGLGGLTASYFAATSKLCDWFPNWL